MKLLLTVDQWNELTPSGQHFVQSWKNRKGYTNDYLSLEQSIELLIAISYNLHKENSDGRFFNNILINNESVIGWDGSELIDILWYEIQLHVRRRLSQGTLTEEVKTTT